MVQEGLGSVFEWPRAIFQDTLHESLSKCYTPYYRPLHSKPSIRWTSSMVPFVRTCLLAFGFSLCVKEDLKGNLMSSVGGHQSIPNG
jgi:hypothetical protein